MQLMGVRIDEVTRAKARAALQKSQVIFTPNPEILLEARKSKKFRDALKVGTLMLPDGHGLLLVSSLKRVRSKLLRALFYLPALFLFLLWKRPFKRVFPEIIHGSDFMLEVVKWAKENGKSIFFLGGKRGVAERTAKIFKKKFPTLKVAGSSAADPSEEAFKEIKRARAQILLVAYGAPKQEIWIAKYAAKIPTLIHTMGVGGSFDFWSGEVKRAPSLLRAMGLEWLWRLFLQPLKRLRRIYHATIKFPVISLFFDD